jgi:hypothetical protein
VGLGFQGACEHGPNKHAHKVFSIAIWTWDWVDIDSIIATITMNYEKEIYIYWLDSLDVASLDEFVTNKNL